MALEFNPSVKYNECVSLLQDIYIDNLLHCDLGKGEIQAYSYSKTTFLDDAQYYTKTLDEVRIET